MPKLSLLIIVIIFELLTVIHQMTKMDDRPARIDALFGQYNRPNSASVSVGIIENGKYVYQKAFGSQELRSQIPANTETVYLIASVSKQFTGLALAVLEQQGKLKLNDSIAKYLPEFSHFREITITHLIQHTSGLRDYLNLASLQGKGRYFELTRDEAFELMKAQKTLQFPVGTSFSYCNSGYLLSEYIIEKITGIPYSEFMTKTIFEPLQMTNTHMRLERSKVEKNLAYPYTMSGSGTGDQIYIPTIFTDNIASAGGIQTNLNDFLKWDSIFYDNRVFPGGNRLIDIVTTPGSFSNGTRHSYAMGLYSTIGSDGMRLIWHNGGLPGVLSLFVRAPSRNVTAIGFSNLSGKAEFYGLINSMLAIWLGLTSPVESWDENGPSKLMKNHPENYDIFLHDLGTSNILLMKNLKQRPTERDLKMAYKKSTKLMMFQPSDYLGFYYCDELKGTFRFFEELGRIMFTLRETGKYPLIPKEQRHHFWIAVVGGTSMYFLEEQGQIIGFVLVDYSRAINLRFVKVQREPIC